MKRIYITAFLTTLMFGLGYTIFRMLESGELLGWGSAAGAMAVVLGFFLSLFLWRTPRTSRLPAVPTLAVVAAVVLGALSMNGESLGVSMALMIGWAVYTAWYSRLEVPPSPGLTPGLAFPPGLTFKNMEGQGVRAEHFAGSVNIWLFFRGNWCPLCMAQIREIAEGYQKLAERGVRVLLVSPQSDRHSKWLATRYEAPMEFLRDPGAKAAAALNILSQDGTPLGMELFGFEADTVFPTVVITDEAGIIRWVDQTDDYRVRPEPSTFLQVIDEFSA